MAQNFDIVPYSLSHVNHNACITTTQSFITRQFTKLSKRARFHPQDHQGWRRGQRQVLPPRQELGWGGSPGLPAGRHGEAEAAQGGQGDRAEGGDGARQEGPAAAVQDLGIPHAHHQVDEGRQRDQGRKRDVICHKGHKLHV